MSEPIDQIRFDTVAVPLPTPVWLGRTRIERREFAICRVTTHDGVTGWGATLTRGLDVQSAGLRLKACLDEAAVDIRFRLIQIASEMACHSSVSVAHGALMRAVSIVDIACWDLAARLADKPLFALLNDKLEPSPRQVAVLVPAGYRRENSTDGLAEEMCHYREENVPAVKTMFSLDEFEDVTSRLIDARRALGDGVLLGNDFCETALDAERVGQAIERVQAARLDFLEDPFPHDRTDDYLELRERFGGRLATGERVLEKSAADAIVARRVVEIARWDPTVCGGITPWLDLTSLAASGGLTVWPHCAPEINAHLVAALGLPYVESPMPSHETLNFGELLDHRPSIRDGSWMLGNEPGLGVDLIDESIDRYRRDRSLVS